jgi:hypothetical protein
MARNQVEAPQVVFSPVPADGALWVPNPGPQTEALMRDEFEILYGGAKGGGKSVWGRMWLLQGNPLEQHKSGHACDISYINHPGYRALVLRLNRKDLETWINESYEVYHKLGARLVESPTTEFIWPSGARFVVDHMADDSVWTKYAGNAFQRMLLEEAGQIPSYRRYAMVVINCRSSYRELRRQVGLTANPGGPGHGWLSKRFLTLRPETYGKQIREKQVDPITREDKYVTRVFIPAKLADNPKLRETDPDYAIRLQSSLAGDENMRRALLDGDWTALSGTYFTNWRPNGPLESEKAVCPWAKHVIEPVALAKHWPRWISMDWGYKHHSVVHWWCQHPNGQVHLYREMGLAGLGPEEFGVEIALASLEDLEGVENNSMTLWLSPDAFQQRTDEKTIADQVAAGVRSVMGPDSSFIWDKEGEKDFFEKQEFIQRRAGIALRRAQNHRVAGWMYLHSLMRFRPLVTNTDKFDAEYAINLAHDHGAERYMEYVKVFQKQKEALPILQVHSCCKGFIAAVPTAMHDEQHNPEDVLKTDEPEDDFLDCARYGAMAHKYSVAKEPLKDFVARRIAEVQTRRALDGHSRMQVAAKAEADWKNQPSAAVPLVIPRAAGRRRVN